MRAVGGSVGGSGCHTSCCASLGREAAAVRGTVQPSGSNAADGATSSGSGRSSSMVHMSCKRGQPCSMAAHARGLRARTGGSGLQLRASGAEKSCTRCHALVHASSPARSMWASIPKYVPLIHPNRRLDDDSMMGGVRLKSAMSHPLQSRARNCWTAATTCGTLVGAIGKASPETSHLAAFAVPDEQ